MTKKGIIFRKILAVLCAVFALILIEMDYGFLDAVPSEFVYIGQIEQSRGLIGFFLLFSNAYIVYRLADVRFGFVRLLLGGIATGILLDESLGLLSFTGFDEYEFDIVFFVVWLCIYLLLGFVFRPRRKEEACLPVAAASAPVAATPAQPQYEEKTVTVKYANRSKAFAKALVPYVKDGWKVEKITDLDRKNHLVYLKRKK